MLYISYVSSRFLLSMYRKIYSIPNDLLLSLPHPFSLSFSLSAIFDYLVLSLSLYIYIYICRSFMVSPPQDGIYRHMVDLLQITSERQRKTFHSSQSLSYQELNLELIPLFKTNSTRYSHACMHVCIHVCIHVCSLFRMVWLKIQ